MTQWERRRERRRVPPFFGVVTVKRSTSGAFMTIERTREPRVRSLLPHQRRLLANRLADGAAFLHVYWGMGSGKTIGGCLGMQRLRAPARV